MDTALIAELLQAVWRELLALRKYVFAVMVVAMFGVLGAGLLWQEKYQTSTMLNADVTNIIEPLLKGRAEITEIDRSKEARELIYTRRILKRVAEESGLIDDDTPIDRQDAVMSSLRNSVKTQNEGKNFFRVSYNHSSPDQSFRVLNAVVDSFIKDSADTRRKESREAYEFIEQQVATYKRQLLISEGLLKDFKTQNLDGTEASVSARINQLRLQIEELKLTVGEIEAREKSLKKQLKTESQYLDVRDKVDEQREQLAVLKERLGRLRLSYQETYPDIISIKEQIKAQQLSIEAMQGGDYISSNSGRSDSQENPLYEELRKRLAENQLDLSSQRKRLSAMKTMLEQEYERARRVASRNAELSELVRDYDVNREIYEEMLGRKEKARLSMTLDVEGQGVNYKIQEPAVYPLKPTGIQFWHFAVLAPLVGLLLPIALVIAYVLVDPRVRSPSMLAAGLPDNIELLAAIPHVNSPLKKRLQRADIMILGGLSIIAAVVYGLIVYAKLSGVL